MPAPPPVWITGHQAYPDKKIHQANYPFGLSQNGSLLEAMTSVVEGVRSLGKVTQDHPTHKVSTTPALGAQLTEITAYALTRRHRNFSYATAAPLTGAHCEL